MKKILLVGLVLTSIIAISSCDYDDSNDIDLLTPTDSMQTNGVDVEKPFGGTY